MIGSVSNSYYQNAQWASRIQLSRPSVMIQGRPAQTDAPVQPVKAAPKVAADAGARNLGPVSVREGVDPAEMATRMRIKYVDDPTQAQPVPAEGKAAEALDPTAAEQALTPQEELEAALNGEEVKSAQEVAEEEVCQTCEERKYQDGSDDMGVSFKTAGHIAPEMAASTVRGHEMEHVVREQAAARREGKEVISQSVTLHNNICPECGRIYVSGGTTRTVTGVVEKYNAYEQENMQKNGAAFSAVA